MGPLDFDLTEPDKYTTCLEPVPFDPRQMSLTIHQDGTYIITSHGTTVSLSLKKGDMLKLDGELLNIYR